MANELDVDMVVMLDTLTEAIDRKGMLTRIGNQASHVLEHLLRLLLTGSEKQNRKHWEGEISGSLEQIRSKKASYNNRPPSSELVYQGLWNDRYDRDLADHEVARRFAKTLQDAREGHPNMVRRYDERLLRTTLRNTYRDLSTLVSQERDSGEFKERVYLALDALDDVGKAIRLEE
jgi:hypothetical protein